MARKATTRTKAAEAPADASPAPMKAPVAVELWPVARIIGYERNARRHDEAQVDQIAGSLQEFGWTVPILLREGGVIAAGHGRIAAVEKLWRDGIDVRFPSGEVLPRGYVPVIVASGWTEAQFRAYVLADNAIAANAEWDDELLRLEIGELHAEGFDVGLVGFSAEEIEAALRNVEVEDGFRDGSEPQSTRTTKVKVGDVTTAITFEQFRAWSADVRAAVGDAPAAIEAEVLRRLGIR